jgi:thiol-disulfide isomerase/thioredoxin
MSRTVTATFLLTIVMLAACGTSCGTSSGTASGGTGDQAAERSGDLAPVPAAALPGNIPPGAEPQARSVPAMPPSTPTVPVKRVVPEPPPDGLARPRPAPEVTDEVWLNGERTSLAKLRQQGKVVLVEFWTFECYNCRNILPALRKWHAIYAEQGLTIVGVHYPEFSAEREIPNVQQAVKDLGIKYLVTIDNDGRTWQAYNQNAWPSLYLVDKRGNIRYQHVGEGAYERTEQWIQYLLREQG